VESPHATIEAIQRSAIGRMQPSYHLVARPGSSPVAFAAGRTPGRR
jgi:hypothetical protein